MMSYLDIYTELAASDDPLVQNTASAFGMATARGGEAACLVLLLLLREKLEQIENLKKIIDALNDTNVPLAELEQGFAEEK